MEKKKFARSKLTHAQHLFLKESIKEMLGYGLNNAKPSAAKPIKEVAEENPTTNIFLKYSINSRFLNQEL